MNEIILVWLGGFLVLVLTIIAFFLALHMTWSAFGRRSFGPYVPTPVGKIGEMLALAEVGRSSVVLEPGSGDGRVSLAAASLGARVYGIEHDPILVSFARVQAARQGVSGLVHFIRGDLWKTRFPHDVNTVLVYGLPVSLERLWEKMRAELHPGTVIVSLDYQFPGVDPEETQGRIRKYRLPK